MGGGRDNLKDDGKDKPKDDGKDNPANAKPSTSVMFSANDIDMKKP